MNVGIITYPINEIAQTFLSNLINILSSFSDNIYVVTSSGFSENEICKKTERIHLYGIKHIANSNKIIRIIKYLHLQFKISYVVMKTAKHVDLYVIFFGSTLLLPIITAKILAKKVIIAQPASINLISKHSNDNLFYFGRILENISYKLSTKIILYSTNLIKEWQLQRYENKILIAHEHFLDFDIFKVERRFNERRNLVGYMGRLSEEKGVSNFVQAIPKILNEMDDLDFLIGGSGPLRDEVERYLDEGDLSDKVKVTGWIPHDEIRNYLNELKLVVLPSYTEGLPNLMLEAMACGTPVLATPVGAIPDIIIDGETGFIMKSNSPECIAKNVMRTLEHPDVDGIVENARALVEREFTYEVAVERYREIQEFV